MISSSAVLFTLVLSMNAILEFLPVIALLMVKFDPQVQVVQRDKQMDQNALYCSYDSTSHYLTMTEALYVDQLLKLSMQRLPYC